VWLTPHLRDPQPEGERERERTYLKITSANDIKFGTRLYIWTAKWAHK